MLTVHICSFSYLQHGIPHDERGHGGGFVFDCRCLPNPGRLAEFAALSGRDAAVIVWLEKEPAVSAFLTSVAAILDLAIDTYDARGFEHLSAAFGCTGGQHRSVFCAEWMHRRLRRKASSRPSSISGIGMPAPTPVQADRRGGLAAAN